MDFDLASHAVFWFVTLVLAAQTVLLSWLLVRHRVAIRGLSTGTWLWLGLLVATGACLRFVWLPDLHNVFYDEILHLDIAMRAAESGVFAWCELNPLAPGSSHCALPKWGPVFHVALAWWQRCCAGGEPAAFLFQRLAGTATVLAAFFAGCAWRGPRLGLWGAALVAFYPLHLRHCTGTGLEIGAVLSLLLALGLGVATLRRADPWLFVTALVAALVAGLTRPESLVAVGPLLLFVVHRGWREWPAPRARAASIAGVSLVLLIVAAFALRALSHELDFQSHGRPLAALDNLGFWILAPLHPWWWSLCALGGVLLSVRTGRRELAVLLAWFVAMLGLYTVVHRVEFGHRDFSRFALQSSLPLLALAAIGLERLGRRWYGVVACALLLPLGPVVARDVILSPVRPPQTAELAFLRRTAALLPQGGLVLSQVPALHRVLQARKAVFPQAACAASWRAELAAVPALFRYRGLADAMSPAPVDVGCPPLVGTWRTVDSIVLDDVELGSANGAQTPARDVTLSLERLAVGVRH